MARCAATPRIWELANEVTESTIAATPTASASFGSRSHCPCLKTLSIRYFDVVGSTSPASRLTTIRARPIASRLRCVQMSARASSIAPAVKAGFLGSGGRRGRRAAADVFRMSHST